MYDVRFVGLVVTGSNVKRDGSLREWDGVYATGNYFKSKSDGATMIEVDENDQRRHVNLGTFNGSVGETEYVNGIRQELVTA